VRFRAGFEDRFRRPAICARGADPSDEMGPWHGAEHYIPASSVPPEIAVQIWNRYLVPGMVGRLLTGQSIKQSLDWGKEELEGFVR
jgi:hypothetical protein